MDIAPGYGLVMFSLPTDSNCNYNFLVTNNVPYWWFVVNTPRRDDFIILESSSDLTRFVAKNIKSISALITVYSLV
jgi:hypothetical protein